MLMTLDSRLLFVFGHKFILGNGKRVAIITDS